jgi:hypothetical protein
MAFRLQITEAHRAGPRFIVLVAEVLEGEIRVGDLLAVPLANGTRFTSEVLGIIGTWPDTKNYPRDYPRACVGDPPGQIGVAVWRPDQHEASDIAIGTGEPVVVLPSAPPGSRGVQP